MLFLVDHLIKLRNLKINMVSAQNRNANSWYILYFEPKYILLKI